CGLADSQGLLIGGRLTQGFGAAMMSPAALSILTTTFNDAADRHRALGTWAGISGLAAAVGVFFGGMLTQDFGWRWVFFVNLPLCVLVLIGAFRILSADQGRTTAGGFGAVGAGVGPRGLVGVIFPLREAPDGGRG